VAEKAQFTVPLALFTVYVGERGGWKRHMERLAENVKIPSHGVSEIAQKNVT